MTKDYNACAHNLGWKRRLRSSTTSTSIPNNCTIWKAFVYRYVHILSRNLAQKFAQDFAQFFTGACLESSILRDLDYATAPHAKATIVCKRTFWAGASYLQTFLLGFSYEHFLSVLQTVSCLCLFKHNWDADADARRPECKASLGARWPK